jgi:spore germination cell wall hydrolase CwlJ-like protein
MTAVQNYIDKHHDLLLRFGGLLSLTFLIVVVPMHTLVTMQKNLDARIASEQALQNQIADLHEQMGVYKVAYAKQQSVQREVQCLAQNIYYEAGTEPSAGKIAVAEVTMNRVKKGYAKTVCGVVTQKSNGTCQFSWVCSPKKAVDSMKNWVESKKIAENILISRKKYGIIGNATYFHADYVDPSWADSKKYVSQIGRHVFYSER